MKFDRPHLAGGPESEVARRNPLRQEAVLGQRKRYIPDLQPLHDFIVQTLIKNVDVVRRIELAAIIVVHVHMDPLGYRAAQAGPELDVRLQRRDERRIAVELYRQIAGSEAVPPAAQLHTPLNRRAKVRVSAKHIGQDTLLPLGGRSRLWHPRRVFWASGHLPRRGRRRFRQRSAWMIGLLHLRPRARADGHWAALQPQISQLRDRPFTQRFGPKLRPAAYT